MVKKASNPRLHTTFLSPIQTALIKSCVLAAHPTATTVTISELGRVGKSGARLLLCYLSANQTGLPFVIKLDDAAKIRDEDRARAAVFPYFQDADTSAPAVILEDQGALIYRHRGARTRDELGIGRELKEIIFDTDFPSDKMEQVLTDLYEELKVAREAKAQQQFVFRDLYRRYLRGDQPRRVLESIFGRDHSSAELTYLGTLISNPIHFLEHSCFSRKCRGYVGPVHGDLHANNTIIHAAGHVHLIDFAWANDKGHLLTDYVLMECSLRFLLFPHHVNLDEQLIVDSALLGRDGSNNLGTLVPESALVSHYERLGVALSVIRSAAAPLLPKKNGFAEYLKAQFLVLFGLMKYEDYNRLVAIRALGMIAQRIAALESSH